MANERIHLQLYRTSGTTQPLAASVEYGELGVGYHNGSEKLFLKNDSNQIVEISSDAQLKTIRDSQDKKISDATGLSSEAGTGGEMSYSYSPESQSLSSFTNMNESVDFIADSLVELTSNVNTIKPEFNVDKNKSNDVYNISYSYQYNGTPLVPKSCTITKYVNEGSGTVILSNVETSSASTTSNIEGCKERYVLDLIPNLSKNIDVRCEETRYLFYVGTSSAETISASDVEEFDKYVGDGEKLIAEASTQNGEYIWIVVPSDLEARFVSTSGVQLPLDEETQDITNSLGSFRAYRNERALAKESWQLMILTGTYTPPPPPPDYSKDYLTFEAIENGIFTLEIGQNIGTSLLTSISYSIDNGQTWTTTNNENNSTVTITTPTINQGDTVLWKGIGTSMSTATKDTAAASRPAACSRFSSTGNFNVSGNIMSLLYGDNFANQTSFESGSSSNFALLFYCYNMNTIAKIVSAENLILPAANSDYTYFRMFQSNNIINPPKLLFTTLGQYSCGNMFYNCTSLTTAPELPATTLASSCYNGMFYGCTSLTTAPELPATTLASNCYYGMFYDCTSLTSVPETLPATTLASYCYAYMFQGCTALTTAPELPATTLASNCYNGMFWSCTSLTTAPSILPATTLQSNCYNYMFKDCTSLTTAPELPATTLASSCYGSMFKDCTSLITTPELPATTLAAGCYNSIFQGCTALTSAPELPATTLATGCYNYMFSGCSNLNYIKALFTTTPGSSYTYNWVSGISTTGTFVKSADATWDVTGVNGVPSGWTVQTASA